MALQTLVSCKKQDLNLNHDQQAKILFKILTVSISTFLTQTFHIAAELEIKIISKRKLTTKLISL